MLCQFDDFGAGDEGWMCYVPPASQDSWVCPTKVSWGLGYVSMSDGVLFLFLYFLNFLFGGNDCVETYAVMALRLSAPLGPSGMTNRNSNC